MNTYALQGPPANTIGTCTGTSQPQGVQAPVTLATCTASTMAQATRKLLRAQAHNGNPAKGAGHFRVVYVGPYVQTDKHF
jgi:hypothetical protein